jgi:hypothetical protein
MVQYSILGRIKNFPTKIRAFNLSISMGFHGAFYFGCSQAMASLLAATQKWGAFVFFGCIYIISLFYVFLAMRVSHLTLDGNDDTDFGGHHWKVIGSLGQPVPATVHCLTSGTCRLWGYSN